MRFNLEKIEISTILNPEAQHGPATRSVVNDFSVHLYQIILPGIVSYIGNIMANR